MIQKLPNGNTLITLGEGTVYTGTVTKPGEDKPFGLYFSSVPQESKDAIIIALPNKAAIASYIHLILRFVSGHAAGDDELEKEMEMLKAQLEPLLPEDKAGKKSH